MCARPTRSPPQDSESAGHRNREQSDLNRPQDSIATGIVLNKSLEAIKGLAEKNRNDLDDSLRGLLQEPLAKAGQSLIGRLGHQAIAGGIEHIGDPLQRCGSWHGDSADELRNEHVAFSRSLGKFGPWPSSSIELREHVDRNVSFRSDVVDHLVHAPIDSDGCRPMSTIPSQ